MKGRSIALNIHKSIYIIGLVVAIMAFAIIESGCNREKNKISSEITTLDSLLNDAEKFQLDHLTRIAELKHKRKCAKNIGEIYTYDNLLYEGYYTLNGDSALKYVDECIALARSTDNRDWLTQSLINKATVLAATGLLKGALDIMDQLNPSLLTQEQLVDYYGQMVYLYSHLGNYKGGEFNDYYVTERMYKDSVMSVITSEHPEYLWYKSWDVLGTNQNPDTVIQALHSRLKETGLNNRLDSKNAYALARLYQQKGDNENYEKYLAMSAIADVKIANSEIAALEDLSRFLFNNGQGDVDRAYRYINYSLDKALNYPNRSRAFGISKALEKINVAYQYRIEKQQHDTKVFLVLVCILAGVLCVAICAIFMQNKKLQRQRKDVDNANSQLSQKVIALSEAEEKLNGMNTLLKELNAGLQAKNMELYEANYVKEEYIGYVFNLCSSYIAKIEDIKRNIYLKTIKKQYKEVEKETSLIDMKDELKDFYHSFDTIFLNIYPNFVNDFNSLLKPDKQIVVKEGELLNMELRIYALVRLGINDSVKIADFLHCASQTVYNYRLRARSRSLYGKEDFLERVKSLGRFQGKEVYKLR